MRQHHSTNLECCFGVFFFFPPVIVLSGSSFFSPHSGTNQQGSNSELKTEFWGSSSTLQAWVREAHRLCPKEQTGFQGTQIRSERIRFLPWKLSMKVLGTWSIIRENNLGIPFFFFSFVFFEGFTHSIWRFPGQGSNGSCSCQTMPEPQQHQIPAESATYTTAHSNTGFLTHWGRPGIKPASSWMRIHFCCVPMGTPSQRSFQWKLLDHYQFEWCIQDCLTQRDAGSLPLVLQTKTEGEG